MHQNALIVDLAIILCVAGIVTVLFQRIKQPLILGYIIAGIIVGPFTPPFSFIKDVKDIRILAELGVIFLIFSLGLDFSYQKIKKIGTPAILIGVIEVTLMVGIGFFSGYLLDWDFYNCLLLGAALSISSTTIIVKALEELHLKKQFFAQLMIGVLFVEDLLAILIMVLIATPRPESFFSQEVFGPIIQLILVIASWFIGGYFAIPYLLRKIQHYINRETLTIISIGLCLFLSAIALYFGYSAALGAFIMGTILAETTQARRIEILTLPIRDIFAAVFFVSVGMLIDPSILITNLPLILLLTGVTIFGKIITTTLGALISKQNVSNSIRIGLGMAQIGEFSFIIVGLGGVMQPTNASLYPSIVAISAITTFITPYFLKWSGKISEHLENILPKTWRHGFYMPREESQRAVHDRHSFKGKNISRFLISALIVAIFCISAAQFFIPRFISATPNFPYFVSWIAILLISSPFLWAMLYGSEYTSRKSGHFFKTIFLLITFVELEILLLPYMEWHMFALLMLLLAVILISCNSVLKRIYTPLEKILVKNITKKRKHNDQLIQKLSLWDFDFVSLIVLDHSPLIGKSLENCKIGSTFGIHVIALKREVETLWFPKIQLILEPFDELIILGEKAEIEQFKDSTQKTKLTNYFH